MSCYTPWPREEDPQLRDFYASNLLQPGWGGLLTLEEARYVRDCLERDARLRRRWGIRRHQVPLSLIAEKAYPEDPAAARRHIRVEQARARRKNRLTRQNVACGEYGQDKDQGHYDKEYGSWNFIKATSYGPGSLSGNEAGSCSQPRFQSARKSKETV